MATKKISTYHKELTAATAPTDNYAVIATDGSSDKQVPLQSLVAYVRSNLPTIQQWQVLTSAQYEALQNKDENTFYYILEDD